MTTRRQSLRFAAPKLRDAEALCATFYAPRAMAGTLQLPLPIVEMWRKRLAESPAEDFLLVAEIDGEVVGNAGLHSRRGRRGAGTRDTSGCPFATTGTARASAPR